MNYCDFTAMSNEQFKKPVGRPRKRSMVGTAAMSNPGRPPKINISEVSYSTKLRRAHEIAQMYDIETIKLAMNFVKRNETVDESVESNQIVERSPVKHSNESGFAFFLENDYSKAQWERLVADSKNRGADIYPSFYMLNKVKEQCRPHIFSVQDEVCVEVSFQLMLNLSAERLVNAVGVEWSQHELNRLTLIGAYGFDSSSGFKNPHQRFEDERNSTLKSELSIFASTFVISALVTSSNQMWLNPTPQSVRFCRPLRLAVEKETPDTTTAEKNRLQAQVSKLRSHNFSLSNGKKATVNFDMRLSMIDGKCLNVLLDNDATTRCPVCSLTMGNFNKPVDWQMVVPESNLQHGIGNLHCEIKTMELLLKLSCRVYLGLGEWTVRKENKPIINEKMDEIKNQLAETFYVRVGEVQQGSGTSLTGNTARKCLKEYATLAEILNINEDLVKRLWYVLLAFRQKEEIDLSQLERYCTETYKIFFERYHWAKMNPSVHKILRHGVAIARQFPLSLAYFAEDAAESMHKLYRKNSLAHARQSSRENRLLDVFNRSVDLSDPAISLIHVDDRRKQQHEALPSDFIALFRKP